MTSEPTEEDLLRAYAASGDSKFLGSFLARYEGRLLRFATRLLGGDHHGAQDVVQETFFQVVRRPAGLLAAERRHNWLLKIARNIGISRMRRATLADRHETFRAGPAALRAGCPPSGAVEAEERTAAVRAAIDRLPPRCRELLLLKVQEEKSYREIAEITGLTVTNVGFLLHRAMKELSLRLAGSREAL
ncbi:MAG TPA: sigma-70 family RNA polymerase sigma factor [Planctomycetota bacterium]|jgi:RNA polymerase sigma-70 factor (ECF subfamily)|nr:sigma-70 family RNA polymerase sigma factor [Planctomycetota bacterium]HNR98710.1 sigma-70 family RNA polymerase sigma factor [Planctomycetota bacterium]HNU25418.1 sigma-70 family RNA polymerase sigma factor [Planctomycetota bacterium]HOE30458.1 sigma-70 family RNA polymerase sigma factor [Planctomycetota bacterium]HOE87729.1 sigma-70 family RNA polymerase sigma factor [Planctomycetota bacterium]